MKILPLRPLITPRTMRKLKLLKKKKKRKRMRSKMTKVWNSKLKRKERTWAWVSVNSSVSLGLFCAQIALLYLTRPQLTLMWSLNRPSKSLLMKSLRVLVLFASLIDSTLLSRVTWFWSWAKAVCLSTTLLKLWWQTVRLHLVRCSKRRRRKLNESCNELVWSCYVGYAWNTCGEGEM